MQLSKTTLAILVGVGAFGVGIYVGYRVTRAEVTRRAEQGASDVVRKLGGGTTLQQIAGKLISSIAN